MWTSVHSRNLRRWPWSPHCGRFDRSLGSSLDDRDQPDDERSEGPGPQASPSWMVFAMGLDQAFERSFDEVRRGFLAENGSAAVGRRPSGEPLDRLEWQGPIVPGSATEAARVERRIVADRRADAFRSCDPARDRALRQGFRPGRHATTDDLGGRSSSEAEHHAQGEPRRSAPAA